MKTEAKMVEKPTVEAEDSNIEVSILPMKGSDTSWNRLWDILLRPTRAMPADTNKQVARQPVKQPTSDEDLNMKKSPSQLSPPNQLSLFDLDKMEPERKDTGPQE